MLKAAIKHASDEGMVRHRQVPPDAVAQWSRKLEPSKTEISAVMDEEREEKEVSLSSPILCMLTDFGTVASGRNGAQEGTKHDRS